MQNENLVGIVVVTYNRKTLLKECLSALKSQEAKNFFVMVVDNCSTDGTFEYIREDIDDKQTFYCKTESNVGGAGGFNFGMKKAMEMNPKYLWLMDDDCIVHSDSLSKLLKFAENCNDDFGYLSSVVKWKDGSICKMNMQKISLTKKVNDFEITQKIFFATFVSFFVKTSTVMEVGLPIKEFFIWGDDLEYSSRISRLHDSYLVADSVVTHKSASNVGSSIVDDNKNLNRYYYAYRNEQYLFKRRGLKGKLFYFLKKLLHILKVKRSSVENKKERIDIIKKAVKDGKIFNPKIEYFYPKDTNVKVLEFFGEPLSYGGQEMFMLNMLKNFSDNNITYTLASPFELTNKEMLDYQKNGMTIYNYDYKFESRLRKIYIKKAIKKVLSTNNYDVIHIQSGSIFTLYYCAKQAKKHGIKNVIVHSHATGSNNLKYKLIKKHSDRIIDKYADNYFGCSELAASWKFPENIIKEKKYYIINNGVNIDKYTFNKEIRERIRKEYNLSDNFVLCHVGRFAHEKNQQYILKLFPEVLKQIPNAKFVMVGAGASKNEFIEEVKKLNLFDKFIFLENISNVNEIMFASDLFVFPSLFEGFPITLIEAQTTGLRFIKSNNITDEALVTDLGCTLSLDDANAWIEKIVEYSKISDDRKPYAKIMDQKGYSARYSAEFLERIYRGDK